jgi:hypothetical protein
VTVHLIIGTFEEQKFNCGIFEKENLTQRRRAAEFFSIGERVLGPQFFPTELRSVKTNIRATTESLKEKMNSAALRLCVNPFLQRSLS